MKFAADFHIHSKYSMSTSKDMDIPHISEWAKWKGIDLIGTGDFTHPLWLAELKRQLKDDGTGLFSYNGSKYILTSEVCNIFKEGDRTRKIHSMIIAPSFGVAERINAALGKLANLLSDGRPVITIPVKKLAEVVFSASTDCMLIPCHIWTPWFSLFGASSGFDTMRECFGEYTRNVHAVETGLSSDPGMNWRISALDKVALISNSDAHSPSKIGREANIFDTEMSYKAVTGAIKDKDPKRFLLTVEFFPEEGKYHHDGHRSCKMRLTPAETKKKRKKCPSCGKQVTTGVLSRIEELADRAEGFIPENAIPYKKLVPLIEIIGEAMDRSVDSAAVKKEYIKLISVFGNEMKILLDTPADEISRCVQERIAEGIERVRAGNITILPGYDGQYGTIKVFEDDPNARNVQSLLF